MKKTLLVYITFLAFGVFKMPESAVAAETSSKGYTVLTDSILETDSSKSVLSPPNHLDSIENAVRQQGEKMENQSSSDVPWWLIVLTILNTFGVAYLFVLKNRNERRNKRSGTSSSDSNMATSDDVKQNHHEKTAISQNHNQATNKVVSSATYHNDAKSRNVVVTTYGKGGSSVRTQPVKKQERRKAKLHRFTNFMIDNGRISTQERTITNDSTDKLFAIDYEEGANVATYTINPECKAAILSDIQTFQNYVEKFSIMGTPTDVVVMSVGSLEKVGKQWVVTEKLIVEFK